MWKVLDPIGQALNEMSLDLAKRMDEVLLKTWESYLQGYKVATPMLSDFSPKPLKGSARAILDQLWYEAKANPDLMGKLMEVWSNLQTQGGFGLPGSEIRRLRKAFRLNRGNWKTATEVSQLYSGQIGSLFGIKFLKSQAVGTKWSEDSYSAVLHPNAAKDIEELG